MTSVVLPDIPARDGRTFPRGREVLLTLIILGEMSRSSRALRFLGAMVAVLFRYRGRSFVSVVMGLRPLGFLVVVAIACWLKKGADEGENGQSEGESPCLH